MKAAPADFAYDHLVQLLTAEWLMQVSELEYLPVGFGAHHWRAVGADHTAYFLALHDLRLPADLSYQQLGGALETAHWLRHVGELEFVLPPIRNQSGNVVVRFGVDAALAVYPWLSCRPRRDLDAADVGHLLARLHASCRELPMGLLPQENFAIPWRTALDRALADLDRPWTSGPYAEATRHQLVASQTATRDLLAWYDSLAEEVLDSRAEWVVTHGEPYGPNLVETDTGKSLLVDWDSALHASRERDLWEIPEASVALSVYAAATSQQPEQRRLRLYRAWYHLAETAIYVHQFRNPHRGDLNDREAWGNLLTFLPSYSNWPEFTAQTVGRTREHSLHHAD
jgi:hypothetical protein